MKTLLTLSLGVAICLVAVGAVAAQTPSTPSTPMPGKAGGAIVKMRGTVAEIDKEKRTITLKGSGGGTLTLDVQDPSKLDVLKVGDPVVGTYVEAVAVQLRPAGSTTPSATVGETRATSKPGDNPAGMVRREITLTGKIVKIDAKAQKVTLEGPRGGQETIKVKDPKNLEGVKAGDLVEISYLQALAVALDKPKAPEKK
jgi:Cu/Ag efflux protein CusF